MIELKLSPFKWAGSKLKEKKKIRNIIGNSKYSIVEPFMGTGLTSGFFGKEGSCFGNDLNFIDDYCTFLYKKKNICSIICNYKTNNDNEIYKGSSEIRSFSGVRSLNLNDVKRINTKSSIYVLYGDFTKSYDMKEYL